MTHKEIQQLISASYTNDILDEKRVMTISNLLRRKDLKVYIRGLKLVDKKHKVYIAMPTKNVYNVYKNIVGDIFQKKELIFTEDPTLLLGMKILDNDMEYDMSLQNRLRKIEQNVEDHYNE